LNCLLGLELLERDLPIVQRQHQLRYLLEEAPNAAERQGILSFRLAPETARRCQSYLEAMERERDDASAFEISQIGNLLLLIVELTRALEHEEAQGTRSLRALPTVVLECIRLIETKLSHPWTIEELATMLCFNRHYLMRLFKQHVGISIVSYLHRSRAERAAILLRESDQAINSIGLQIGWPDPNYFARRFKEHFGVTATEYRNGKR
jgi:AraC family transcriptional regulator, L-rhamnose operon transcriptional activator RhaR